MRASCAGADNIAREVDSAQRSAKTYTRYFSEVNFQPTVQWFREWVGELVWEGE